MPFASNSRVVPLTRYQDASASAAEVAIKLIFAVDASDSIEDWEWRLELSGIAAALRSRPVQEAIAVLPGHRLGHAMLVWADATQRHDTTGWRLIDGPETAAAFAAEIETWPRRVTGGTGMGEGVASAISLLKIAPWTSRRQIIDVSGDGVEPLPLLTSNVIMMREARAMAAVAGVIINGLCIVKDRPDLYDWYVYSVMTGPGAFVMQVKEMRDFPRAFQAKLLKELQVDVA